MDNSRLKQPEIDFTRDYKNADAFAGRTLFQQ